MSSPAAFIELRRYGEAGEAAAAGRTDGICPGRHPTLVWGMRLLLPTRCLLLMCCLLALRAGDAPANWNDLPEAARTLVDGILERNLVLEPELDADAARAAFAELVAACRPPAEVGEPAAIVRHLNQQILTGRTVGYLSAQYWRDSSFAAALLRRKGNCLATTTLYVAIGRALGLPIHAVFVPRHAFACWADGRRRLNLETTAGGRSDNDLAYMSRFAIDGDDFAFFGWMKPADDQRLFAELDLVVANHLAGQQRLAEAQATLARALAALPWRRDLELLSLEWAAQQGGDRAPLLAAAARIAGDAKAPRAAVLAAVLTQAADHRARLDRAQERAALQRAYALAPWHQREDILHQMSTCLRGLRDHAGAALCMELAVAHDPTNLWKRAWLAGMLSEAKRHDEALTLIAAVRAENPEEVYFATMQAGMLVQGGRRAEGRALFDGLRPPRTGLENYECNRAWFLAVWGERAEFYPQFERALAMATDPGTLSWIAEDDDLDQYREEERFKAAVAACRARLLKAPAPAAP